MAIHEVSHSGLAQHQQSSTHSFLRFEAMSNDTVPECTFQEIAEEELAQLEDGEDAQ